MGRRIAAIFTVLMLATGGFSVTAATFADMKLAEVSALLASAPEGASTAPSAKEGVAPGSGFPTGYVAVNAHDLMTKVYGFIQDGCTRADCIAGARKTVNLTPDTEGADLWLDSADGYRLSYDGMAPDVSAMARMALDSDSVREYCFFFLFPYHGDKRKEDATRSQADFSGALLQEMADMEMPLGADANTDDLFDVEGAYQGRQVNVRLLDDLDYERYILMVAVRR